MSTQVLNIPVGHSRWLQQFSLASALFALLCWQFVDTGTMASIAGSLVITAMAIWQQLRSQPCSVLSYHNNAGWRLARVGGKHQGQVVHIELRAPYFVNQYVVALCFVVPSSRRLSGRMERINLCLCADAVPAELHRKLRVLLNTQRGELNGA